MPAIVSKFMFDKFQDLQAKARAKRDFIDRLNDDMHCAHQEIERRLIERPN